MFESLKLPISYRFFETFGNEELPLPPYLIYIIPNKNNISADSKVYIGFDNIQLELYTIDRDAELVQKICEIFDNNNIYYDIYETYIQTEELYQTVFLFSL